MAKNILADIKKSLDFLDNTTFRYIVIALLVIYSSFISIQYNYSTMFNHWLVRLFFLLVIVYVSIKDPTIALLIAVSMLISINYKSPTHEAMTLNCQVDPESASEGFETTSSSPATPPSTPSVSPSPIPANVPSQTFPSSNNQGPAPSNTTVKSSQPASISSTGAGSSTAPGVLSGIGSVMMPAVNPPAASNASANTPTLPTPNPMLSMSNAPTPAQTNEGFRPMRQRARVHTPMAKKSMKEHFAASGYTNDYNEDVLPPVSYTKRGNCGVVLQNTDGSTLDLNSECGAVATFQGEMNAQGFIQTPMGYHPSREYSGF
jgi:hypothetical protein